MNAELTEQMYRAFPYLYRVRTKPPDESVMCYGFECGNGWYQVLYDLSQELTDYMLLHPFFDLEVMQVKINLALFDFISTTAIHLPKKSSPGHADERI